MYWESGTVWHTKIFGMLLTALFIAPPECHRTVNRTPSLSCILPPVILILFCLRDCEKTVDQILLRDPNIIKKGTEHLRCRALIAIPNVHPCFGNTSRSNYLLYQNREAMSAWLFSSEPTSNDNLIWGLIRIVFIFLSSYCECWWLGTKLDDLNNARPGNVPP